MKPFAFLTTAFLLFAQTTFLQAQTREVNETEINGVFAKYMESQWSARAELMTPSAWSDYVGDMLYAYKNIATTLLDEYEVENYQFPEMPSNYKRLPNRDAIEAASKVREKLVTDLSNRLGMNLGEFLDRLDEKIKSTSADIRLTDVKILATQTDATAECHYKGGSVSLPMRFKLVDGKWKFDGKNEVLFFDRQRETDE